MKRAAPRRRAARRSARCRVSCTSGEGGLLGLAVSTTATRDLALRVLDHRLRQPHRADAAPRRRRRLLARRAGVCSPGSRRPATTTAAASRSARTACSTPPSAMPAQPRHAQDPTILNGKILRMTPTGDVPADNPFAGSLVYSLGHRNPQGLAWDADGQLWAAEFGQNTWDEFNRIEPGGNYGWPIVEGIGGTTGFIDPVHAVGDRRRRARAASPTSTAPSSWRRCAASGCGRSTRRRRPRAPSTTSRASTAASATWCPAPTARCGS